MKTLFKLRPAATTQLDFYVFDTETVKRKRHNKNVKKYTLHGSPEAFYFGVVYGHNYTRVIHSVKEFIDEFNKPRYKGKKVFAHNLEYDLMVIYDNIYDIDPKAIFNGRLICATNGNCLFADSFNIFPTSARKIGEMIKKEKGQLNKGNIDKWFNDSAGVPVSDINYCIRDCEIIYDALFDAFEFSGQICITQASLAMKYFCRYHLEYNIHYDERKIKHFFKSYYGGRVEAFKIGNTHAVVEDVNSMYPDAMRSNKFPNPLTLKHETIKEPTAALYIDRLLKIIEKYEGCAKVTIHHFNSWVGYLPVRKDGKLIFPVGTFTAWFNFPELRYALKAGIIEIKAVFEIVYSKAIKSPFTSYVDTLYPMRFQTESEFKEYLYKLYLNMLYGKFAQQLKEETIYLHDVLGSHENDIIETHQKDKSFIKIQTFPAPRRDGFLYIKSKKNKHIPHAIPSFASYITSYARVKLLDRIVTNLHLKPAYCDTDSVFFEIPPAQEITISTSNIPVLGAWKLENKIVTEIRGLKNYRYIDEFGTEKRKLKGVPKTATEIRKDVFEYWNLTKTRESLRRNIESGIKIKRTKEITNNYDKRIVGTNGETKPIKL